MLRSRTIGRSSRRRGRRTSPFAGCSGTAQDCRSYRRELPAETPAANGIGTARSLARAYAACVGEVDGVRILNEATVKDATTEVSNGADEVLLMPSRFGSGFFLSSDFSPLFGERSFGHADAGGLLGKADPDGEIGFGYVMNKMQHNLSGDPRTMTLVEAVKQSL